MLTVAVEETPDAERSATLDGLVAEGARRMLAVALEAEVDDYLTWLADQRDEHGRRLVVRNGHAEPRTIVTGAGPIEVRAPRVDDRRIDEMTGERCRFRSSILPPWARKSPKVAEVLPLMYLHGMSSGDFVPALEEFFGSAAGLSASVITRLTTDWQRERDQFSHRSLKDVDYVYLWADGIHFNIRLEEARLCALVIVDVRADGTKELVSITDGHRESTESWADVLRDVKRRGMTAPVLAVGDGVLGFWGALADVFPDTAHQRCWVHKMANVMNALPKSAQPAARAALAEVHDAEDKDHADRALEAFVKDYEAKWPNATEKVTKDRDALLAFFDFPAEHWIHLKTTDERIKRFAACPGCFVRAAARGRSRPAEPPRRGCLEGPGNCRWHTCRARAGGPRLLRCACRSLALPADDHVLIGGLGLLQQGPFTVADGLERVGGRGACRAAPSGWVTGAEFEGPGLLGDQ